MNVLFKLSLSEWLAEELRVRRGEDVLSDTQRQEYQQWVCMELYLSRPEDQGGCGGDLQKLCSQLLSAVMEQQACDLNLDKPGGTETGTSLPDILSRLQELVYEMEVTHRSSAGRTGPDLCDFLFDEVSQRCSSSSASISTELSLQRAVLTWNRVLLVLPAALFIKVKSEGGRLTLDCSRLIEHINLHQRKACSGAGLLSFHVTAHMLKGVLYASAQCGHPGEEVNKVWSEMSVRCPLLLLSAVHWWQHLSPLLMSLWRRLHDGGSPPEQMQLLSTCLTWSCSLQEGRCPPEDTGRMQTPTAGALLLAASLHRARQSCEEDERSFRAALNSLRPQSDVKDRQVLVFLLFLCVNDYLSAHLFPQEQNWDEGLCTELLTMLSSSPDWLLIFITNERSVYHSVTMVTSDERALLMPLAFCSLLLQQSAALQQTLARGPGFLHAAVLCYTSALQRYLDGRVTPAQVAVASVSLQTGGTRTPLHEVDQILRRTKQFLLSFVPQTSPAALSSSQLRQLTSRCADLDPELAAALSVNLDPHSPEMDFLCPVSGRDV